MEKMTYVTEDGTILFTPPGTDPDTGCTITGLAADGKYMYLEDIALHLAKTEHRLKKYLDTDLTTGEVQELSRMYQEKCEELARLKAQLYPCILAGGKPAAGKKKNGWIPIVDRLPEKIKFEEDARHVEPVHVTYLTYYEEKPECREIAIYCEDNQWRWFDSTTEVAFMDKCVVKITAWQPLPEPWKG